MNIKLFQPLGVSTYFATCSMPLNLDTYRYCSFQCRYCFMRNKIIGKRDETLKPNIDWLKFKFKKIYDDKNVNPKTFLDVLLKNRIDIHCGTKCEAFQPIESVEQNTKKIIDICNEYDQHIVFTTKSDSYYDVDVNPDNHSFQFSITNHYNDKFLEPGVPLFEKRVEFYNQLKDEGFKVGIRFEPTIPNITEIDTILSYFEDVDHVHFAKLTLLNQLDYSDLIKYIKCSETDFAIKGKKVVKDEVFYIQIRDSIEYLEEHGYSWSTRFINLGNDNCCCGDNLVKNPTSFDTLHLKNKYGENWTLDNVLDELGEYKNCNCYSLFTSNRRNGLKTIEDFYRDRFDKYSSKFNPKNQFKPYNTLFDY